MPVQNSFQYLHIFVSKPRVVTLLLFVQACKIVIIHMTLTFELAE